jgi:hypothetical protein
LRGLFIFGLLSLSPAIVSYSSSGNDTGVLQKSLAGGSNELEKANAALEAKKRDAEARKELLFRRNQPSAAR